MQIPYDYGGPLTGGPGFATPLSSPPSQGTGGGGSGPSTQWTMEIKPAGAAGGGMVGNRALATQALARQRGVPISDVDLSELRYGGIVGLAGGGYLPLYAHGGYIPGYGIGGFLKGLGKGLLDVAPIAANFIPGVGPIAAAGIGALSKGIKDKASGKGFNLQSMLGSAGRAYALGSGLDRIRNIEGLKGEGLWGGLGKILGDADV